jgi:UV DNA damage repair endonuclease
MAKRLKTGGRMKGTPSKITKSVREQFASAFYELQEDSDVNLVAWGKDNPTEFYRLASKLIPLQLETEMESKPQTIIQIIPDSLSEPITE